MAATGYGSDSSLSDAADETSTSVLIGYATREATDDTISHLGGTPTWLAAVPPPPGSLAQCRACNSNSAMSLLLELHGDLPDRFPGHERRLYLWACRRKACRRKEGSVRGFRCTRVERSTAAASNRSAAAAVAAAAAAESSPAAQPDPAPKKDLGAALFGGTSSARSPPSNPFAAPSGGSAATGANPFASAPGPVSELAAKPPQKPSPSTSPSAPSATLPESFASKLKLSSPASDPRQKHPETPWPPPSSFPPPFAQFYLDAEYEYLSSSFLKPVSSSAVSSSHAALMDSSTGHANEKEDKDQYEDTHDKTFQRFADRLAENPEQVLRYEFGGAPLLYARDDSVGRIFGGQANASSSAAKVTTTSDQGSRVPRCSVCGSKRVFEMQLMPQAIAELESGEEQDVATSVGEGMEWGTIVMCVCEKDCLGGEDADKGVGYVEEWAGVQWEETIKRR